MTYRPAPNFNHAEGLRKDGNFEEAAAAFAYLWRNSPGTDVGWRCVQCLRKLGRLEEAEEIANEVLAKFPDDQYTKSHLAWVLYDKELKPAKDDSDLDRIIAIASRMIELSPEGLILAKATMAVMKVAKGRENWSVLLEWADRLSPNDLDTKGMTMENGKDGMPDREIWYINRSRALYELGLHDEARQCAQEGLIVFPDEIFLLRTAALALAGSGNTRDAIIEMKALLKHRRAAWYMKAELAEMFFEVGDIDEAYRAVCDALSSNRQSEEYLLTSFVSLARYALALGKLDVAAQHVALSKAIRTEQSWKIPAVLSQVEQATVAAFHAANMAWPDLPTDSHQLEKLCRRHWQSGKTAGVQMYRGTLKPYPEGRAFAHIKRDDGGEDVFVLLKEIPRQCSQAGSRLEFSTEKTFDKKKNRESTKASNIRCLK